MTAAATSLALAVFFVRAWSQRRQEIEYLVFGLMTACLAAHAALMGAAYYKAVDPQFGPPLRVLVDLLAISSKLALPLLVHFALRYARVKRVWLFMAPFYGLMGVFIVMIVGGVWWANVPEQLDTVRVLGLEVHHLAVKVTTLAYLFYAALPAAVAVVLFLLGRVYFGGRREALTAFIGAGILTVTMFNDAALGTGWYPTVPLLPVGYLLLSFGVCLTLVTRYGTMSTELEDRTEQLRARSDELSASYLELQRTQQELVKSEQLAMVGELSAVIAHQVRNPLAIVSNAVAGLRKGDSTSGDHSTLLQIIDEEMGRLDMLVGHLLNYARPVVPQRRAVDIARLVERSLAVVDTRQEVACKLQIEPDLPAISADPDLLRQAFENVATNAIQAMNGSGALEVLVEQCEIEGVNSVAVDFTDNGEGMSKEAYQQAFTPFFTTRPTGTGLGLSIVDRIAEAHGGAATVSSKKGSGTTVSIVLPVEATKRLPSSSRKRISWLP